MTHVQRILIGCIACMMGTLAIADQDRARREMVETLEAYAVYKMGLYEEAFDAWLILAEKGNSQGILNVANMYQAGEGVERDLEKAFYWYQQGANQGDPRNLFNVARCYAEGLGTAKDAAKAQQYYQQAAGAGSIDAQRIVGMAALKRGDQTEAEYWLKRAAAQGDQLAESTLKDLGVSATVLHPELTAQERLLISDFLENLSDAANARDSEAMTDAIQDKAQIRVRLPGQATYQELDKAGYQALWQVTFDKPVRYRFNRIHYQIEKTGNAYRVDSQIREYLTSEQKTEPLLLDEVLWIQIKEDEQEVTRVELQVRRAGEVI